MDAGEIGAEAAETRQQLEVQKLNLEIALLKRPWWQSPALASAVVASLFTVGVSWYAGLFDLKLKEITLRTEQAKFERDQVNADLRRAETIRENTKQETRGLQTQIISLRGEIGVLTGEAKEARHGADLARAQKMRAENNASLAIARAAEAEKQLRDLARPALEITRVTIPVEHKSHFRLDNWGPGPAILKRMRFFVDSKEIKGRSMRSLASRLNINETFMKWHDFDPDARIPKGTEQIFFWVRDEEYSDDTAIAFERATDRVSAAACYCSIDNRCGWTRYGRIDQDLGACP